MSCSEAPGEAHVVDLNVFTLNKRSIMLIDANLGSQKPSVPIAFVAIGAMLVGSIGWSKKVGDKVAKGEELGWFQVSPGHQSGALIAVRRVHLYHRVPERGGRQV